MSVEKFDVSKLYAKLGSSDEKKKKTKFMHASHKKHKLGSLFIRLCFKNSNPHNSGVIIS